LSIPRLDRPRACHSHSKWRALSPGEKLERPFGPSLDRMADMLSGPAGELDRARLNARVTVARVWLMIGDRPGLLEAPTVSLRRRQGSKIDAKALGSNFNPDDGKPQQDDHV
jgi:hypothetical protein